MNDVAEKSLTDLGFVKTYSNEFVDVFTNQSIGIIGCVIT